MSSSPKPLNLGAVGLSTKGWAAFAHFPALADPSVRSKFNLYALSTSSETSANAAAAHYTSQLNASTPIKAYYGDATQIIQDPEVDVVAVMVNVPHHKEIVDKAIAAGKDFFVEWPATKTLEETEEIRRKVNESGKIRAIVGLQARQSSIIRKVKKILDLGKIGKVLSTTVVGLSPREGHTWQPEVTAGRDYLLDEKNGASLLSVAGGHHLDSLIYLLGTFESLNATASVQYPTVTILSSDPTLPPTTRPSISRDHFTITGLLRSGAHASLTWRSGYPSSPGRSIFYWIIDGELGSIKFESDVGGMLPGSFTSMIDPTVTVNGQALDDYIRAEFGETAEESNSPADPTKGTFIEFIRRGWSEFGKTLEGGKGEHATLDDAVMVHRVLDAVERSLADGGRLVELAK